MALYDRIGSGYDATRRADPEILRRLLSHLRPEPGLRYLDLACGSGNYTAALAGAGLLVHGVDRSPRMIAAARSKRGPRSWLVADAAELPYADGSFAGVICTNVIHHFPAPRSVFQQVFRALSGGRFVLFTAAREQMRGYWLNHYYPDALEQSIEQMPELTRTLEDLRAAGFRAIRTDPYEVAPELRDLFLYGGKHRPELYLDPRIRAGISTFSALADPAEVRSGCARLEADIRSGRIADVVAAYRHDRGDYLFIIAEKGC